MSDAIQAMAIERAAIDGDNFFDYTAEQRQIVLDDERHILQVLVRAAVGCPECGGTGEEPCGFHETCDPCPAEHVQLSILGPVIYADPSKVWWACFKWATITEHQRCGMGYAVGAQHKGCGWQPRMDALFGEASDEIEPGYAEAAAAWDAMTLAKANKGAGMSDRPYWWHWIADRLPPYPSITFRSWVVFAIIVLDRDGLQEARRYWRQHV